MHFVGAETVDSIKTKDDPQPIFKLNGAVCTPIAIRVHLPGKSIENKKTLLGFFSFYAMLFHVWTLKGAPNMGN